jgi:hypothetical protein
MSMKEWKKKVLAAPNSGTPATDSDELPVDPDSTP